MKVPFRKSCFGLIALIFFMITANAAIAQGPPSDPTERAKILQPDLVDRLDRGETVDIIVLLKGYKGYEGKIKADNPAKMKMLQSEIRRNQNAVMNRLNRANFKPRHVFENILGFSGTINRAAFEALASMPEVESIEEDRIVEAHLAQGILLMNGSHVRSSYDGAGVSIAIVDTGIDYTHSMLGGAAFPNSKVIGGWDFGDNDPDPMDCYGHGTSVAGIAAGTLAAGPGDYIGGVAPDAKLYALKIVSGCGDSSYDSTIVSAWNWAITHKNDNPANPILVINTSFGGGQYFSACDSSKAAFAAAANTAVANGITLFSSSGNNGFTNSIAAPACVTNSISVGAVYDANIGPAAFCFDKYCNTYCTDMTTAPDQVTCYSNSADFLDILAPSNSAYTTAVGGGYAPYFGGTSAASPYAAGAAAVLQNYAKSTTGQFYTPASLKARLVINGDPITDSMNGITKPRVNIGAAAMFYSQVALGAEHTVALRPDGTLWAWGLNNFGQLGDGTTVDKIYSVQIGTGSTWVSVASGWKHSLAIKSDGTLWAWGYNHYGQLGDGTTVKRNVPVRIGTGNTWASVFAGAYNTVALKSDGTLWTWGMGTGASSPVQMGTGNTWVFAAVGWAHTMALKSDGTLWAWGNNSQGQLGDGTMINKSVSVQIGAGSTWVSVAAGEFHTAAVKSDGTLWAWGYNYYGQLGDGTTVNKSVPVQIGTGNTWFSVAGGEYHTAALKSDGTLWAWGNNRYGQLGDGTTVNKSVPVQTGTENTWISIEGEYYQTAALKYDGTLWAWGRNFSGQLGDGTTTDRHTPTQATGNGRLLVVTKAGTGTTGTVISSPSGINCGADCKDGFPLGSSVTLTAVPNANASFAGWSGGGCSGTNASCTVTMSADMTVTATFNVTDIYGRRHWCGDPCGVDPVDTCNSDIDGWFTCPTDAAFTCFDVANYDDFGPGEWELGYRTVTCVPSAPGSISVPASSNTGNYTVSWAVSASAGVTYRLEEATNSGFTAGQRTVTSGSTSPSALITGRADGVTYYYRVRAEKNGLVSNWLNGENGCVVTIPPAIPASISVPYTNNTGNFTVSWGASATAGVTYRLEEATNSGFTSGLRTVTSGVTSLSASITGRTLGYYYFYRVRAEKGGQTSAWRNCTYPCTVPFFGQFVYYYYDHYFADYLITDWVSSGVQIIYNNAEIGSGLGHGPKDAAGRYYWEIGGFRYTRGASMYGRTGWTDYKVCKTNAGVMAP